MKLTAANSQSLGDDHSELSCRILFEGTDQDSTLKVPLSFPFRAYDAPIDVDAIVSYEWLAKHRIDVHPRRHGILVHRPNTAIWVPGAPDDINLENSSHNVRMVEVSPPPLPLMEGVVDHSSEDYIVRREFFLEFTRRLKIQPTRDCFTKEGEALCKAYYNPGEDALIQDWNPEEVLWINPPWRLWPQVAKKLLESGCSAICVIPAWSKPWVRELLCTATKRLHVEQGTRLFIHNGRKSPSTLWGVWVVRIDKNVRSPVDKTQAFGDVVFLPRWRPAKNLATDDLRMSNERLEYAITKVS